MDRRHFLAALPTVALAGCLSGASPADSQDSPTARTPPAGIELVEFTHTESVRAGQPGRFGAVLRNAGDTEQGGTAALELSLPGGGWRQLTDTAYELAPGEQELVETTATTHFLGSQDLRLVPFDGTVSVDVQPQSVDYGTAYTLPSDIDLTLGAPRRIESYESDTDGQQQTATVPDDRYWDLLPVTATNEGDETAIAPYRPAFETLGFDWQEAIPYRATDAYEGGPLQPEESRTGRLLFETREMQTEKGFRLRHPYEDGTVGAVWSAPQETEAETG